MTRVNGKLTSIWGLTSLLDEFKLFGPLLELTGENCALCLCPLPPISTRSGVAGPAVPAGLDEVEGRLCNGGAPPPMVPLRDAGEVWFEPGPLELVKLLSRVGVGVLGWFAGIFGEFDCGGVVCGVIGPIVIFWGPFSFCNHEIHFSFSACQFIKPMIILLELNNNATISLMLNKFWH